VPQSFLDTLIVYFAEQICSLNVIGRRSIMAGDQQVARLKTKSPAQTSISKTLQSDRADHHAQHRPTSANDMLVRFQQEIVPQLDAAYNFARFLSRDADAAADIVQEAFLRAYRGFGGYQGGDARAWLFTIVRNCYHNWLIDRRRRARVEVDVRSKDNSEKITIDDVPSDEDSPEANLLRRAQSDSVRLVLGKLPRSLREMLVLREIEGLSYRQIAEIAVLPIGTVMSRLARARAQFERAWRQETSFQEDQT
jgi:RNA polymerase sigma factor (sigma-70 family)